MNRWSKIVKALRFVLILVLTAGLVYVIVANISKSIEERQLDSMIPAIFNDIEIINKDDINAGSVIRYKMDYCRYVGEDVKTDALWVLTSEDNKQLAPITIGVNFTSGPPRCDNKTQVLERIIPAEVEPGNYRMRLCAYYHVVVGKPPKSVCITTETFEVKKATQAAARIQDIQNQIDDLRSKIIPPQFQIVPQAQPLPKTTPPPSPPTPSPTIAKQAPISNPKPASQPAISWKYKVYSTDDGRQLGVYNLASNAVIKYKYVAGRARICDTFGNDLTKELLEENK